ncbi:protein of unknown function DUF1538 [Parvibaculum lavamentivorans DS-1]|uniref:DUF1538 domain-containing protein n=1 Tax=Parvibaculum lavamentivorans (strain DS-1 / DSM 13023 / NCIMB 13966) TaxID=402881 RepID=A7HYU4_PARL1|nr:DUF1538 domain-containing protein [Parvibaculum lavamentivorans]ABS65077.1 protein of unknown function DUF1538 [Parvibaculum lavamentivorans DS-1]
MEFLGIFAGETLRTLVDLAPLVLVIGFFQFVVVRKPVGNLKAILVGLAYVALGLTLFRIGLEQSLIPIGGDIARALVIRGFVEGGGGVAAYLPLLVFAGFIGFSVTLIEPTLIAAGDRVQELSGGTLRALALRLVIACGVAIGLVMGTLRIVDGIPLAWLLAGFVAMLIVAVALAPKEIVPLALDSGGMATSVVTVPMIAAYGVAVAEAMPNEATAADGFGLIVLALLSPAVLLLAFASIQARLVSGGKGGKDAV